MIEIEGDLWELHSKGKWICITTNGTINRKGDCVMGKGIALEAKRKFPTLPKDIAGFLKVHGNKPACLPAHNIITFPTKHDWWEKSDPELIISSCKVLRSVVEVIGISKIYLPRPGCDNGKLNWETDVKPILKEYLNEDKYIVVTKV